MSLFSLFSGSSSKYSPDRHPVSREEILHFFRNHHWSSVSVSEEGLIEDALVSARDSSGKISLRKVYEVLKRLEDKGKISINDRKILMRDLSDYLNKKFTD